MRGSIIEVLFGSDVPALSTILHLENDTEAIFEGS